ncbi:hypothetical protein L3X38_042601 [Prunus dulcis]|uniref:Uncharacterized protein n=1 Tax=Prunus dulcis TaxID=3755 RepID=A0AAD4UX67_PRUDU|nr:hypothetical protein L3X38_042601 [Prunus dulcis]
MNSFRRALRNGARRIVKFLLDQKVTFFLIIYYEGKIVFSQNKIFLHYEFLVWDITQEVLERQERDSRERAQRKLDEQLGIVVALLEEENQSRCGSREGCGPNVDRHRHSWGKNLLEEYFIPHSLYSDVHFRVSYRMQPHLFNKVMHDICNYDEYFVQKKNCAGNLGLLPKRKFTAVIQMLAYGSSADQVESLVRFCDAVETLYTRDYLRRPMPRDLQLLLQKAESRGFPGMIGSIDCMHWQ